MERGLNSHPSSEAVRVEIVERLSTMLVEPDSEFDNFNPLKKRKACFMLVRPLSIEPMPLAAEIMADSSAADAPAICCVSLWKCLSSCLSKRGETPLCCVKFVAGNDSLEDSIATIEDCYYVVY